MRNRMSVLSRRLARFAVCFSALTFCFLLIGFYAHANNEGQVVYLAAVSASGCFFVAFFLWLAHGFAWAMIPENTGAAKSSADSRSLADSVETPRLAEPLRPAEAFRPVETMKPAEAIKPAAPKPAEALKPVEAMKSQEEKATPPKDPPNAKYTITGRRIS